MTPASLRSIAPRFVVNRQPALDQGIIRELTKLEWLDTGENALFLGPPGVGKTHLAIGLGRRAIQNGTAFCSSTRRN